MATRRRSTSSRTLRRFRSGRRNLAWVGVTWDYEFDGTAISTVAMLEPENQLGGQAINQTLTIRRIIMEFVVRRAQSLADAIEFDKHDFHGIAIADEELAVTLTAPDPALSADITEERWLWNGMTYWHVGTVGGGDGGGYSTFYQEPIKRLDFKPNKRLTSDEELIFASTGHPTIDSEIATFLVAWARILIEI